METISRGNSVGVPSIGISRKTTVRSLGVTLLLALSVCGTTKTASAYVISVDFGTPTFNFACEQRGRTIDRSCSYSYLVQDDPHWASRTASFEVYAQASADRGWWPGWDDASANLTMSATLPVTINRLIEFVPLPSQDHVYQVVVPRPTVILDYTYGGYLYAERSGDLPPGPLAWWQSSGLEPGFYANRLYVDHYDEGFVEPGEASGEWWADPLSDTYWLRQGYSVGELSSDFPTDRFVIWRDDVAPFLDYASGYVLQSSTRILHIDDIKLNAFSDGPEDIFCAGIGSPLDDFSYDNLCDNPVFSPVPFGFTFAVTLKHDEDPYVFLIDTYTAPPSPVVEPGSLALLSLGLLGLGLSRRRKV